MYCQQSNTPRIGKESFLGRKEVRPHGHSDLQEERKSLGNGKHVGKYTRLAFVSLNFFKRQLMLMQEI